MKVAELIKQLQTFDQGLEVVVENIDCDHLDVDGVRAGEEEVIIDATPD